MNDEMQVELITALKSGDPGAFALLYDDYSPVVYGLILRIVQDEKEAENLFKETFIKIWNRIHLYSPERGRFATWMFNIARNTALDFTKSLSNINGTAQKEYPGYNDDEHPVGSQMRLNMMIWIKLSIAWRSPTEK